MSIIYLATPYSHPDLKVRRDRFDRVNKVAARLMRTGMHIFSPISHTHPIAMVGNLPTSWEYWKEYDEVMIKASIGLYVLRLEGWEQSTGVAAEIKIATGLKKPVKFIDEDYLE